MAEANVHVDLSVRVSVDRWLWCSRAWSRSFGNEEWDDKGWGA